MRTLIPLAALVLAGCATGRGRSEEFPQSDRGFASPNSLTCAHLVLDQRGYRVESGQGVVRGGRTFPARDGNVIIVGIVTARIEPSDDGRAALRVQTERRVTGGASRRMNGDRLYPSPIFDAEVVKDDADAVLRECTQGAASSTG